MKKNASVEVILAGCVTIIISSALGVFLRGFVFQSFWSWFVIPAIPLAAPISFPVALGLSVFYSFLMVSTLDSTNLTRKETDDKINPIVRLVALQVLSPLFVLFVGWLIHNFV